MFVTSSGQRLYLTTWCFNAVRVMGELASIVTEAGGRVKPVKAAIVSDRSLSSELHKCRERLEKLREVERTSKRPNPARTSAILNLKSRVEYLESLDNSPIEVYGQSWINFVLDNKKYYFSIDDNMFMDLTYSKIPLNPDGTYNGDYCIDAFRRDWMGDFMFSYCCPKETVRTAAQRVFDALLAASDSRVRVETHRVRVPNRYNSGFHYEMVPDKPRISRIDF